MERKSVRHIVITGPESTGKTQLSKALADYYKVHYIPEFARTYIEQLKAPYTFEDVETIAKKQLELRNRYIKEGHKFLFYDTYLVVTKVWFEKVYDRYPSWFLDAYNHMQVDLFLVCNTDIPWIPDKVRENGGPMREVLLKQYIKEMEELQMPWALISGTGEERLHAAVRTIDRFMDK